MKKIITILALFGVGALAQTATTHTTLCAAMTTTSNSVCLASTTGVVNQTGIYVDGKYMLVQLSNTQTLAATNAYAPVSRANRSGSIPTAHANGAIAWVALTPGSSLAPGVNGFVYSTQFGDQGPCVRANELYLPHIWPDRGVRRDCAQETVTSTVTPGVWVDYAPASGLDNPSPTPLISIIANGALSVSSGNYVLNTKAGGIALTLAAPTAGVQDGMVITIIANNGAHADTLTATGLIQTGGAGSPYTTATFGVTTAFNGATLTLRSYNGYWYVISSSNVAFS